MPTDFDRFWQDVFDELARYPAAPETEVIPIRFTDYSTMYGVRLTSLGPYRLFAYLGVPHGDGPFPAVYYVAKYGSVVETIPQGTSAFERSRYVTLSIAARGQRNADQPFAALFPGLLTEGVDDPGTYVFRGIVADCVRGLEFLLTRPELDPSRVVAVGNEMALATAALRDGLSHVVCTPGLFFEAARLATRTDAYPLEEINDYVRLHPEKKDAVHRTLSYFHPRMFAPRVGATTLLLAGAPGTPTDSQALRPLAKAFGGEVTVHESEHSSYKDGLFEKRWISDQLGFDEPVLPEAWR